MRSISQLDELATANQPYAIRQHAIAGLTLLDMTKASRHAGVLLSKAPPPGHDPSDLFAAFLARKDGARALAKAFQQQPPASDAAKIGLRVLVERGVPAPELLDALQKSLGNTNARRKLDAQEMKRWITLVQKDGDPTRGEAVFRRAQLGCYQCHALGGAGGRVGPDLSGIGTSAQLDYLIESVFLPSKVVREGYTTAHIVTKDGRTFSGVLQRESAKEVVLKDPIRDEIVIAVNDIDEKRIGGSLMPDGLDQSLTDAELADLFRFLGELGKPGPFAVTHRAVARRWQHVALPASLKTLESAALGKLLQDDGALAWKPIYARVSGDLPLSEANVTAERIVLVRCQLEVVSPGSLSFQLNGTEGITLWTGGKAIAPQPKMSFELSRGSHTFTFRIDLRIRKDPRLRFELVESADAKGQAKFVDGR